MKYIFTLNCFAEETPEGTQTDYCKIQLYAGSVAEAEKRAKEITGRKEAQVSDILEKYEKGEKKPQFCINIQAYLTKVDRNLVDVVNVELWDVDPNHALETAKKLIDRKFYRFNQVIENPPTDE